MGVRPLRDMKRLAVLSVGNVEESSTGGHRGHSDSSTTLRCLEPKAGKLLHRSRGWQVCVMVGRSLLS